MAPIAPISAAGLVRAALVEVARNGLPPDEPEVLRAVAGLAWRVELQSRWRRAEALHAAARATFGANVRTAEALVREAHDVDLQRRLEELLLGRLEPAWIGRYLELTGVSAEDPPAVYVALDGPHPLLGVLALASARPGLVALHASGEPGETMATRAADRWLHRRFTELRLQLPVLWEAELAAVPRALAEGRSVHLMLNPARPLVDLTSALTAGSVHGAPLATVAGAAPLRVLLVHRERDKRWRVEVSPPLALSEVPSRLADHVRRWPGQFLPWCLNP